MNAFDKINKELGLTPMTPVEMNRIHLESGEHTPLSDKVADKISRV